MTDWNQVATVCFNAADIISKRGVSRSRRAVDDKGRYCALMALSEAAAGEYRDMVGFHDRFIAAMNCLREATGAELVHFWSDESPNDGVVLDGLQAAGKLALRKADER